MDRAPGFYPDDLGSSPSTPADGMNTIGSVSADPHGTYSRVAQCW